jgi:tRNA dimethylallyltransferase
VRLVWQEKESARQAQSIKDAVSAVSPAIQITATIPAAIPAAIPILAGPTASGKTALSLQLAQQAQQTAPGRPIEIVSADAMMVYRGMDIGTAKPSLGERAGVPHHLLDLVAPDQDFSVVAWVQAAEAAIGAIVGRGHQPLLVGGTGFYLRALAEGLPTVPPSQPAQIAALEAELAARGLAALVGELATASPQDAARAAANPRRVLRALEIWRSTGRVASDFMPLPPKFRYQKLVLAPTIAQLEPRIAERTAQMLAQGLLAEAAALAHLYQPHNTQQRLPTSLQAIGYREALAHLAGDLSHAAMEAAINLATRQYAKRQLTWFRAEPNATAVATVELATAVLIDWLGL